MERTILHCDLNNFYASVEQLSHPEYDGMPIAVSGNPEVRHGIVLAKNMLAKEAGVATGEALWIARRKCPDIVFLPPHYDEYVRISKQVFAIYTEFTDRVESFGLDECWLDVTGSLRLFNMTGKELADKILHQSAGKARKRPQKARRNRRAFAGKLYGHNRRYVPRGAHHDRQKDG